ncbi:MAG: hypothetical protein ACRD3P_09090 [Terriglobales bacterium]
MAEPPNRFTALILDKNAEETYDILRRERCLSSSGLEQRKNAIAQINEAVAEARHQGEQHMVGGTSGLLIFIRLAQRGFLNRRAKRLFNSILVRQHWWQFWRS